MFAIIDLEWTSWKNSLRRNWSLEWEHREIIQIGTIKCKGEKIIKKKNIYIKPKLNKQLSTYVQILTGATQYKINTQSIKLENALAELEKFYKNVDSIYCNGLDKKIFNENCKLYNLANPLFLKKVINIGPKISEKLNYKNHHFVSGDLNEALGLRSLNKHNALGDCMNIFNFIVKKKII